MLHRFRNLRSILLVAAGALALGAPAAAQGLKLNKPSGSAADAVDPKKNEKRAHDAVVGYYQALFQARYDQAGAFVHPDAIEPVRTKLLELLERAAPAQQKATLETLGMVDVGTMRSISTAKFFAAYSRSKYSKGLQDMAQPQRKPAIKVTNVACESDRNACLVTFVLEQTLDNGQRVKGENKVWASKVDGRWLVGEMPGLAAREASRPPARSP